MNQTSPALLVAIPCLNEEVHLAPLVKQLLQTPELTGATIAIVDGGSSDKTLDIAHKFAENFGNVFCLENTKRFQSAAVNLAVRTFGKADGLLIRLDAHATYPSDYFFHLVDEASRTGADSVVVPMETIGTIPFQKAVATVQNSKLGNGGSAHRKTGGGGEWIDHGHHALMSINAFRAVGGYDETFTHNEDAELDYRLTRAGYKIWLTDRTSLIYHPRSAPLPLFKQYFSYGRGRARTLMKHRMVPKLRQLLPVMVAPAIFVAILSPLWPFSCVPLCMWLLFCLFCALLLSARSEPWACASLFLATTLMHSGWSFGFWSKFPWSTKAAS